MMRTMKRSALLLAAVVVWGQGPAPVAPLQFDAASVKAAPIESGVFPRITSDPGRLKAQAVSIEALIAYAYECAAGTNREHEVRTGHIRC